VKKPYQIRKKQAIERFRIWAAKESTPVQLAIPTAEVAALAQTSLGDLLRTVGKLFIETVMENEVDQIVGERSKRNQQRGAYRWGIESGYCIIDGQRVPLARPRIRNRQNNQEIPLGSYELFQRGSLVQETVWHKIMHGLTMRSYKEVVQQLADAYGLEKSTTSDHFVEASRLKVQQLMKRSLIEVQLPVMVLDGTIFEGEHMMVAVGIDRFGHKIVLGLRQGGTENAAVVEGLLGGLAERGLDFSQPRLYLLDGSRAIRRAISTYAGEAAFFQRCQVHKIRNVTEHLPDAERPAVKFKMRAAYEAVTIEDTRRALYKLHDELMEANPSAAASLVEGLEETLTILDFRLAPRLRRTLSNTNAVESGFSVVEKICRQVKPWQGRDHRLRWVASALVFAESRWNRLQGYRHMPALMSCLDAAYGLRVKRQKAAAVA
jgi:transposase-like protein